MHIEIPVRNVEVAFASQLHEQLDFEIFKEFQNLQPRALRFASHCFFLGNSGAVKGHEPGLSHFPAPRAMTLFFGEIQWILGLQGGELSKRVPNTDGQVDPRGAQMKVL